MFRKVTDGVFASPQIGIGEVGEAAAMGVTLIINNRPDGEEFGQPEAATMAAAAHALGLDYLYAPVRGMPNAEAVEAVEAALNDQTPVLMHCKSGMRSTVAWALAAGRTGQSREDIVAAAADAGFDLSNLPF